MAAAQANPVADTILAQAIDGSAAPLNFRAPAFTLTDQHGRTVTLASLRGKVVLLTFLDPVCTGDCPLEAQEFRQAGQLLAADTAGRSSWSRSSTTRSTTRSATPRPSTGRKAWPACRTGCT